MIGEANKKPLPCGRGFSFILVRWVQRYAIAIATAGASPGTQAEAESAVSKAVRAAMIACPMAWSHCLFLNIIHNVKD